MLPFHRPIGPDTNNVFPTQTPFIDPGRGYPNIPIGLAYGEIAPRSRSHAIPVNALHGAHNLIAGVNKVPFAGLHSLGCIPRLSPTQSAKASEGILPLS